jgi:TolA-binding protein
LRTSAFIEIASIKDETGEYEAATETYLRGIRDVPENDKTREAYLRLAELYFRLENFHDAVAICRESLLRYPGGEVSARIRYVLGRAYRDSGTTDRALDEFYHIAETSSLREFSAAALIAAADILKKKNDLAAASEVYDRILTEYPDSKMADYAQYEIGAITAVTGGNNSAILAFQSMIINFPDSSYLDKVYYRLGELYSARGDNYSALENFNKVADIFPESGLRLQSLVKKADILYRMGRYEESLDVCRLIDAELVSGNLENTGAYRRTSEYISGWALYRLGIEDRALQIFSRMMNDGGSEDGLTPGVIFWFGEYFYDKGDFSRAREYFSRVIEEFPESNFARDAEYWMGWALYDDNMLDESLRQFVKVATSLPNDKWAPQATLTVGDIYKKRGEIEEAILNYKTVANSYRDTGIANIANNRIGIILKAREEYVLAMEYFRMALTGDNTETNAQIQFDLAECYEKSGDYMRALEEYLKVEYRYPAGDFWLMRSRLKCAELFEARGDIDKAYKMYEKLSRGTGKEAEHAGERMRRLKRETQ